MTCYYIYSPFSDQAIVIATFLRKYFSNSIIGVVFDIDDLPLKVFKYYDQIILASEIDTKLESQIHIPTGAISTEYFLRKDDLKLGEVTMKKQMLDVFNKSWLISQAIVVGVPVPKTWKYLEQGSEFPLFYKEIYEKGGGLRGIAFTKEDVPKQKQDKLIFQEFINSPGTYGVSFLADQGHLLATHTHFEKESLPKEGGSAILIENFYDLRLQQYTKKLIRYLNYSGWGLAEFKYCYHRNDYVLMEINAKFWASCELAFANEPQFLKLLFNIESREKKIKKIFFIGRAYSRGLTFLLQNIHYFFNNQIEIRDYYPGCRHTILGTILPKSLKNFLKNLFKILKSLMRSKKYMQNSGYRRKAE